MHQGMQGSETNAIKQFYTSTQNPDKSSGEFTKTLQFYYCPECNRLFQFKSELIQHQEKHISQRSFICKECNQFFNYTTSLLEHLHLCHSGIQPYKCAEEVTFTQDPNRSLEESTKTFPCYYCSECNKLFKCKSELTRHQRMHTGQRPFLCKECNKSFNYNSSLLEHLRVHSGEKPYKCTECNKCFRQGSTLNRHKKTHTGEKPHKCEVCGKCFAQRRGLKEHKLTHSCKQPFYCSKCRQYFVRKRSLLRHNTKEHSSKEPAGDRHADCKPDRCSQANRCLSNGSTLQQVRSPEIVVKVEKPDEDEISLEMLVKSSDLLNNLREELTRDANYKEL